MKVYSPDEVRVRSSLRGLLEDLVEQKERLEALGEFERPVRQRIEKEFFPKMLSDTLNIESVHVNPRITLAILEGQSVPEGKAIQAREVKNIAAAAALSEDLAQRQVPLDARLIRTLQGKVIEGAIQHAGQFRREDVRISGADLVPPSPGDVPALVEQVVAMYEGFRAEFPEEHPVISAAWLHATVAAIHPFTDGNGRTARLLQDYSLARDGYLPVGIPASRREEYYAALAQADIGEWNDLIVLIANSQQTLISKTIGIVDEFRSGGSNVIRKLAESVSIGNQSRSKDEWELWRAQRQLLVDSVDRLVGQFNRQATGDVSIAHWVLDEIPFETWLEARDGEKGSAPGSWISVLSVRRGPQTLFSLCIYARRHISGLVNAPGVEVPKKTIGFFVTGSTPEAKFDFYRYSDPVIRIREIVFHDSNEVVTFGQVGRATGDHPGSDYQSSTPQSKWSVLRDLTSVDGASEVIIQDGLRRSGVIE